MALMVIGGVGCITLGMVFARTVESVLCRILLYAVAAYPLIIFNMMSEYISLVSKNLTHKEKLARKRTMKELGLKEDELKDNIGCGRALRNHYRFFC